MREMMVKLSITFLRIYDHGIGKGMPLPKLSIQRVSVAVSEVDDSRDSHGVIEWEFPH